MNPHVAKRLKTKRTLIFVLTQVGEALFVEGVPASWKAHAFFSRLEEALKAY